MFLIGITRKISTMERRTFTVMFFIRRTKLRKNLEAPVFMRITMNGERAETSVQYLLFHLNQSDIVLYKCACSIVSGLVLVLIYAIGYHDLKKKENIHKPYKMEFMAKFRLK
jgi:hypothetical protein